MFEETMDPKAEEALAKLSDQEWADLIVALTRYAFSVSRNLRWRTNSPLELPGGETVDSIVSKAIEKLYSGDREWHPDEQPDLNRYLQGVIDSLLNHLAEAQENVMLRGVPEPGSKEAPDWESGYSKRERAADWLVPTSSSPRLFSSAKNKRHWRTTPSSCLLRSARTIPFSWMCLRR